MNPPAVKPCPFSHHDPKRILAEGELTVVYKDGFPGSQGHTVIVPRQHFSSPVEASEVKQTALLKALAQAKGILDKQHQPDGYNIGTNRGRTGGQTMAHLHTHLIPRYQGDKEDPRGGVRWVLPEKVEYCA